MITYRWHCSTCISSTAPCPLYAIEGVNVCEACGGDIEREVVGARLEYDDAVDDKRLAEIRQFGQYTTREVGPGIHQFVRKEEVA